MLTAAPAMAAQESEEPIVVTGQTPNPGRIRNFVDGITLETADDQLAAFQAPVCAFVSGLSEDHDRFIAARVMDVADAVGPGAETGDCDPNLIVVFTPDPGGFLTELRDNRRELLAYLTALEIRNLLRSDDAVTSWQLTDVRGADGREMERLSCIFLGPVCEPTDARRLQGVQATRTRMSVRQDFVVSMVVVDTHRIEGASLIQIADLIAMRSLARTRPGGTTAVPTILSLVEDLEGDRQPSQEATQYDLAYLRALYGTDRTRHASGQRSAMARSIAHSLGGDVDDGE